MDAWRAQTQNQPEYSPTRKLINQMEIIGRESRNSQHKALSQERNYKSIEFQKKKLQALTSADFARTFKPPSANLELFWHLAPLSCGQEFIPPVKNIERSSKSNFRNFRAGSRHMQFFEQRVPLEKDQRYMNLKFGDYCEVMDKSEPKCRRKRLNNLSVSRKPMLFSTTNGSFNQTFNSLLKESSKRSTIMSGFSNAPSLKSRYDWSQKHPSQDIFTKLEGRMRMK